MERYICIHGHFYQPPRENPWLEAIEIQDSAVPFHDWNERITAECYGPNTASRILNGEGEIAKIVNNYSKISFNFGPTLLSWMKEMAPETYQSILLADKESQKTFGGHGAAMAQAYNHIILPLANRRDRYTQILWGIRDFEHRFGRFPEGMWLPETAVDLETLDILAQLGIRFTILSPHQAKRVRRIRGHEWVDVAGGRIDPSRPYEIRLPSRRRLNLFFYDGPVSHAVAFEHLLSNGEHFAARLLGAFAEARTWPQIVHIATDGETYGHHQRYGDMALAYALQHIEANQLARVTNYGEYLEKYPPTHEVEIFENSSWSCAHGVERWRSDCGCNSGMHPEWKQAWRAPLRDALNWLRDTLAPLYGGKGKKYLKDPWAARNDYIQVILDRSPESIQRFLEKHAVQEGSERDRVQIFRLLELQRHALLMFTSCGWFFDELSGLETVQVVQYAGRVVQLAQEIFAGRFEHRFLERLEKAKSNIPEHRDGRLIYEKFVKPTVVDLEKVGAHYAVRSLFAPYEEHDRIYCYAVDRQDYRASDAGKMRLVLGRGRFTSKITRESALLTFGVLHFGDHNITGGVREFRGEDAYQTLVKEISDAFSQADLSGVIRALDKGFSRNIYTLRSLFRDEQRRALNQILKASLAEAENAYRQLYEHQGPVMRFLVDLGFPLPKSLLYPAELALNGNLLRELVADAMDQGRIQAILEEARRLKVSLDGGTLGYSLKGRIEKMAGQFRSTPTEVLLLQNLTAWVKFACALPIEVDFWKVQNLFFDMRQTVLPEFQKKADAGEENAKAWVEHFNALGDNLNCRSS